MTQTWVASFHRAGSVNTPLAFGTQSPLTAAVQNAIYGFSMAGTGGFTPYTWALLAQTGSNGWSVSSQGTVSGIPSVVETDTLTIQLTDSAGTRLQGAFSLTVNPQPQAALPTFSPPAGTYAATQFVTISCATAGSTCYYTTDGSAPTFPVSGTTQQFTGPVIVNASETLRAIGTAPGFANSAVASAAYTIGSVGATFDFYVSPTGSDTNDGKTVSTPWSIKSLSLWSPSSWPGGPFTAQSAANCALTAGKRVGLMPGTYDISGLMVTGTNGAPGGGNNSAPAGALHLLGGTSSSTTYWGSCDATGHYSPRTATLNAKGSNGLFGGGVSSGAGNSRGPMVVHCVNFPTFGGNGFATIDGLRFTGGQFQGTRFGSGSTNDGPAIVNPVLQTNCEFTGFGFNAGSTPDNVNQTWVDHNTSAVTISNNWYHDSVGPTAGSGDHFNAIQVWGFSATNLCVGTVLQYNTCVNSGNVYGKEGGIHGSFVLNNFIDVSMFTSEAGVQDFSGLGQSISNTLLTAQTVIQNNIVLQHGNTAACDEALGGMSTTTSGTNGNGWMTPVIVRNNTVINAAGSGAIVGYVQVQAGSHGVGQAQCYNNLYANPAGSGGTLNGAGVWRANPAALLLMDYNLSPATNMNNNWVVSNNATLSSGTTFSTPAAFGAAILAGGGPSGVASHDVLGAASFVNTGLYAAKYQLNSGTPGQGAGRIGGVSSGAVTDMGAWGGLDFNTGLPVTQIGCSFAV
jgi:hypothetical protein